MGDVLITLEFRTYTVIRINVKGFLAIPAAPKSFRHTYTQPLPYLSRRAIIYVESRRDSRSFSHKIAPGGTRITIQIKALSL
jgi:hypothetical protein